MWGFKSILGCICKYSIDVFNYFIDIVIVEIVGGIIYFI